MKLSPLQDRVLVRRVDPEPTAPGGILIPDIARERPAEAEVVAVGPGRRGRDGTVHPLAVKSGDRVLIVKRSGIEVTLQGVDLVIVRETDIMGVFERTAPRAATRATT